jgi:hypothetical protein
MEMSESVMKEEPKLDAELLAKAVVRLMKRDIFDVFIKTGELSAEDQEFCDRIDWYPVDELHLREEYVKKLKQIEKGPHSRMTLEELDELMGLTCVSPLMSLPLCRRLSINLDERTGPSQLPSERRSIKSSTVMKPPSITSRISGMT